MPHIWTDDEVLFIRNFWRNKSDKWMANKLGVPVHVYKYRRQQMHLLKHWTNLKGRCMSWTFAQVEFLRTHYPDHSCYEIAKYINHSTAAIKKKAKRLGLSKSLNPGRRGFDPIENYYNNPIKISKKI